MGHKYFLRQRNNLFSLRTDDNELDQVQLQPGSHVFHGGGRHPCKVLSESELIANLFYCISDVDFLKLFSYTINKMQNIKLRQTFYFKRFI